MIKGGNSTKRFSKIIIVSALLLSVCVASALADSFYAYIARGSMDGTVFTVTSRIEVSQSYSQAVTSFDRMAQMHAKNTSKYGNKQIKTTRQQTYEGGSVTSTQRVGQGFKIYYCKAKGNATLPGGAGSITRTAIVDLE